MTPHDHEPAQYLNVDLEIASAVDFAGLLAHIARKTVVLMHEKKGRSWVASLELHSQRPRTPDAAIRAFVKVLQALPPTARRSWNGLRARTFNIGIQSGTEATALELNLAPETLAAASALGANIAITVYPPVCR